MKGMTPTSPSRRHPAGTNPQLRTRILEGANAVFLEKGFDAAGVNDICRAAGISKSTLYVYFDNKEELFEAMVEQRRDAMLDTVARPLRGDGPVRAQLSAFLSTLVTVLCSAEVIRAQRIIIGIAERMPDLGARFYDGGANRSQSVLAAYLETRVAAGELAIARPKQAAYQLIEMAGAGLVRQRLFSYRTEPPLPEEVTASVESALDMFLAACAVPPRPPG